MTTLVKRNGGFFPELPMLFDDPFLNRWLNSYGDDEVNTHTLPSVNIRETHENFEITVAAPGMKKNDFKVEVENNRLVISGERKEEKENQSGGNYLRKEYSYQSFVRSFALGEKQVDGEKVQAKYSDGILYITLPKLPEAKTKPTRLIPIN